MAEYSIEFTYTLTVEAKDESEASDKAWEKFTGLYDDFKIGSGDFYQEEALVID